jgi:two-component system, OmpR family, response regulator
VRVPSSKVSLPLQVFIVEDDPDLIKGLTDYLEEVSGANVVGNASEESSATDWLAANASSWDLLVVDLFLNQGNGLNVLTRCRSQCESKNIVVLTNYATVDIRRHCITLGANAVFDKSTELEEFGRYACSVGAQLQLRAKTATSARLSPSHETPLIASVN